MCEVEEPASAGLGSVDHTRTVQSPLAAIPTVGRGYKFVMEVTLVYSHGLREPWGGSVLVLLRRLAGRQLPVGRWCHVEKAGGLCATQQVVHFLSFRRLHAKSACNDSANTTLNDSSSLSLLLLLCLCAAGNRSGRRYGTVSAILVGGVGAFHTPWSRGCC